MCGVCGCGQDDHHHHHDHPHDHHHHDHLHTRTVELQIDVLAKNDRAAQVNREWLKRHGIFALNLTSSPGAGKTTLLERTLHALKPIARMCVIEGDQETERDAERIRQTGCPVVQINTGAVCHLDAEMVARGLRRLEPSAGSLLFIENVGNLVCPSMFDLGESSRVVVFSLTEGEDKPLKYPHMFRSADVMVLNKLDLAPHLDVSVDECVANARRVNPRLRIFMLSASRGDGMNDWCGWLESQLARS